MTIPVWQYNNQHDGVYGRPAIVGVHESDEVTSGFHLLQNYPNPFNPTTTIAFSVKSYGHTSLRVFDLLGREVATLVNEVKPTGTYKVGWDATRFSSGVYYYRLSVGGVTTTKKMLLTK
jgi:hypothetical protein